MRGDWCSIYATLRKKKGTGKNETEEGSRDGEGGRGRVHKILSMDTKRAALKDDRFEFIDDHRQRRRGLLTSMTRDGKKKKNDREMTKGESRTMEGRKRMFSLELLNCKFRIVEIHYRL